MASASSGNQRVGLYRSFSLEPHRTSCEPYGATEITEGHSRREEKGSVSFEKKRHQGRTEIMSESKTGNASIGSRGKMRRFLPLQRYTLHIPAYHISLRRK